MEIQFATKKIMKVFNDEHELARTYGSLSKKIKLRMNVLRNAPNLAFVPIVPPDRCHMLKAERAGQFAVDLIHPYRLVFKPSEYPPPITRDGNIDKEKVVSITIIEVVDYHD
jgi:proteic killer suppression protein